MLETGTYVRNSILFPEKGRSMSEVISLFGKFSFSSPILEVTVSISVKVGGHHIQLACISLSKSYLEIFPNAERL